MKLFEIRVERRGDLLIFEAWREGEEEPFYKHQTELSKSYLDAHLALYGALRAFEQEVHGYIMKEVDKKFRTA
ncbi:MAG: hypothetical protein AAB646_03250 [Patescibacteria group bacterium]